MKSQFAGIVKVKKQILNKTQMELLHTRQKAYMIEKDILSLIDQITTIQTPKSGSFMLINQTHEQKRMLNVQKVGLEDELEGVQKQILYLEEKYKNANKEYEKMNYLKTKEEEEFRKKEQKQEQMRLDEISIQLFARGLES